MIRIPKSARHFQRSVFRSNPQRPFATQTQVTMHGSKRVLVPVANGSEEMEAVIIIDVLRRAGAEATVAAVGTQTQVECSRGVKLMADRVCIVILISIW